MPVLAPKIVIHPNKTVTKLNHPVPHPTGGNDFEPSLTKDGDGHIEVSYGLNLPKPLPKLKA